MRCRERDAYSLRDQILVDGVACRDHSIEERCPEGGQQSVGVAVCWQLTPIDSSRDERNCPLGLVVEVASGCFAQLIGSKASGEDQRDNLAPDTPVQYLGQLPAAHTGLAFGAMFDLDGLSADSKADGIYEFMFSASPLPITGASGSPASALAIK